MNIQVFLYILLDSQYNSRTMSGETKRACFAIAQRRPWPGSTSCWAGKCQTTQCTYLFFDNFDTKKVHWVLGTKDFNNRGCSEILQRVEHKNLMISHVEAQLKCKTFFSCHFRFLSL